MAFCVLCLSSWNNRPSYAAFAVCVKLSSNGRLPLLSQHWRSTTRCFQRLPSTKASVATWKCRVWACTPFFYNKFKSCTTRSGAFSKPCHNITCWKQMTGMEFWSVLWMQIQDGKVNLKSCACCCTKKGIHKLQFIGVQQQKYCVVTSVLPKVMILTACITTGKSWAFAPGCEPHSSNSFDFRTFASSLDIRM